MARVRYVNNCSFKVGKQIINIFFSTYISFIFHKTLLSKKPAPFEHVQVFNFYYFTVVVVFHFKYVTKINNFDWFFSKTNFLMHDIILFCTSRTWFSGKNSLRQLNHFCYKIYQIQIKCFNICFKLRLSEVSVGDFFIWWIKELTKWCFQITIFL